MGRFQPSRAGIINLWDYRDEEFLFVNGWLLLRGPNGSGKTKALEVLFPFVLDARIEPRRLNPFASEERTMKSNLLYRGHETQYAYVWMEFRRGEDEFTTIGIGLRAHRHNDRVQRWHFVVDGRVGVDFSLIDSDDRPLNKRDLAAEIGADHVYEGIEEYRRAVDARLFGLGSTRYDQMLDLVLTLRKPMLAKDLNPVELSRTLQRGLRPLDDGLVTEAARSFDDMESVARTLEGLVAADEATSAFLGVYSTYLRTHARAAADSLTARRSAVIAHRDAVGAAEQSLAEAQSNLDSAIARIEQAEGEPGRLRSHLESLKASDAYRSLQELGDLRQHVATLAQQAARAQATSAHQQAEVARWAADLNRRERESADALAAVGRLTTRLATAAERAGIAWSAEDADGHDVITGISARLVARREDVRVVREHLRRLGLAEAEHARRAREVAEAHEATADAETREHEAEAAVTTVRNELGEQAVVWAVRHQGVLDRLDVDAWPALLERTVMTVGEPGGATLREAVTAHAAPGVARVTEELAGLRARRDHLERRRDELVAERAEIAAARDDAPAPQPARWAPRADRPGAPLWRLVDFAPTVGPEQAAAVEAALQAAGILDAWVHPTPARTATAIAARESDGYLVALPASARPSGRTLADLLLPEHDAAVPTKVIADLLASVPVLDEVSVHDKAAGQSAVTTAGQFSLGVLVGAHTKPTAEFIGVAARERRRALRIAECERQIAEVEAALAEVVGRESTLRDTLDAWTAAVAALPSVEPVRAALTALVAAATTLRLRHEAETAARAALDQAVAEQAAAGAALRRAGTERSLPPETVDTVADAVDQFQAAGDRLEPARAAATVAARALEETRGRHGDAVDHLEHVHAAARDAAQAHAERHEAYETLAAAVEDGDAKRVQAEVAATEQAVKEAETRLSRLQREHTQAYGHRQGAETAVEAARLALRTASREAGQESVRLRPFAHADLLTLLRCPTGLRWPASSTVDDTDALAPEVVALHEAILAATRDLSPTESSLKQSATRVAAAVNELQAQLPAAGLDHACDFATDDGLVVVRVRDEQGLTPVAVFGERIVRERREQEQLLSDAERRVFEDALLTQLARQIHHRAIEARDLVRAMDTQMRARRMSSGLTVGVGWHESDDLDAGQKDAIKLLEKDPARLNPAQLANLRSHFATRIKAARAMSPDLPYRELLAQVLDYRQWHVFAFFLHRPGFPAEKLTRARHSQLSGGEQSVSLHLPLFAAANALFTSASPTAPRLIGLDEAFAGVDETGRGELMALAGQFDLDLFMTGYDLWATHPAVAGCAHYDLAHSAPEQTVATVLIVWNGLVSTADFDGTLARALGSPETRRVAMTAPASTVAVDELSLDLG